MHGVLLINKQTYKILTLRKYQSFSFFLLVPNHRQTELFTVSHAFFFPGISFAFSFWPVRYELDEPADGCASG